MKSSRVLLPWLMPVLCWIAAGCARRAEPLLPPETFRWVRQSIVFAPPPARWERQGDSGGGLLGVRFILRGGGQEMSVAAFSQLAERDRRAALQSLISQRESLSQPEFMRQLSLARAPEDDPISEREATAARAINMALDHAVDDQLSGSGFVASDLQGALRTASDMEPTLEELLPRIRLRPEQRPEPDHWRIGYERDTVIAGHPAFASDDTLIVASGRPLLYHEVLWVVHGCAFKATYQGLPENLATFQRVVDSIRFPEPDAAAPR